MSDNQILEKTSQLNSANILNIAAQLVNFAPNAKDDEITATNTGNIYIKPETLLANDIDFDGDNIHGIGLHNAVNGEVYWDGTQVIFVPKAGYTGPASFEYIITDDKGGYDRATVNLTIVANHAPVAADDVLQAYAFTDIVISVTTLLANDTDVDGDEIIGVSLQDALNGSVSWDGQNVIFTADEGYVGPASFSYTIQDIHGETSTATVNLTILPNAKPVAVDDVITEAITGNIYIKPETLLANDSDLNGDNIRGVGLQNAVNGEVYWDGTQVIFVPKAGYSGPASFEYIITDDKGGYDQAKVNLTVKANGASDDYVVVVTGDTFEILAADLLHNDIGTTITTKLISVQGAEHGSVTLNEYGVITFTPENGYTGQAAFSYTYQLSDDILETATVNIEIGAERVRTVTTQSAYDLEGGFDVKLGVPEYNLYSHVHFYNKQHGRIEKVNDSFFGPIIKANWTSDDGFVGLASYDYSQYISSFSAQLDYGIDHAFILAGRVNIHVEENLAPTANQDAQSGIVNQPIITPADRLLANDTDPEGQDMKILSVQEAVNGTVVLQDNNVIFTPTIGFIGQASYTYTMIDRRNYQSTATVKLSIKEAPDAVLTDQSETITLLESEDLLVNRVDSDNLLNNADGLNPYISSYTVEGIERVYTVGVDYSMFNYQINLTINADGSYQLLNYSAHYFGALPAIHYTVRDDNGNETISTLNINITNVNDAPYVENSYFVATIGADQKQLVITTETLLNKYAKDFDGDSLTVTSVHSGQLGTAELIDNKIYFTPQEGSLGKASFQFSISDGNGGESTGVYHLTINPEPLKLEAADDHFLEAVSDEVRIPLFLLQSNDDIDRTSYISTKPKLTLHDAVNGDVWIDGDAAVFRPKEGYSGPASFNYTLSSDEPVLSDTATVNLTINTQPQYPALVAHDDQVVFSNYGTGYNIKVSELLANDESQLYYLRNRSIRIVDQENVQAEIKTAFSNISYEYVQITRENGYSGPASFEYAVSDGLGNISTATVNLIWPESFKPLGSNDNLFITHTGQSVSIDNAWLLKNDSDPNGDDLTIVSTQNTVNSEATLNGNQINFTSTANAAETASFQYSIHDGQQNYHFAKVDVNVQADGHFVGTDTNDIMIANAQTNTIDAKAGDDVVIGGAGDDVLTGGLGADVFVWSINDITQGTIGVDRITDFDLLEDKLDLQDLIQTDVFNGDFEYMVEKQLADYLDFNVVNGSTEISMRNTLDGEIVQKVILENVLLPETDSPALPLSYDANLLIEFKDNLIYI